MKLENCPNLYFTDTIDKIQSSFYTRKNYSLNQNLFHLHTSKTLFHEQENVVQIFICMVKLLHETTFATVPYCSTLFNLQEPLDFERKEFISYYSQNKKTLCLACKQNSHVHLCYIYNVFPVT